MTGPAPSSRRVCLGVVVGAHGIQGAVRVKSFTADPLDVAAYGPVSSEDGARVWPIRVQGASKGVVLCRLEGVRDRSAAEALKGQKLWIDRAALPEDDGADADGDDESYYHADLIGLRVEAEDDGRPLGTVRAVHDFGAGDVLDIAPPAGGRAADGAVHPRRRAGGGSGRRPAGGGAAAGPAGRCLGRHGRGQGDGRGQGGGGS